MAEQEEEPRRSLGEVESRWGEQDAAHFGYGSDEERKAKRGLEDWELVEKIPESQKPVPYWFFAVVLVVLLVGIGLAFPFWGLRPGQHHDWLDWGFAIALAYISVAGYFVYFMVRMYGSSRVGRLDSDPEAHQQQKEPPAS
ncbi:MAG: hypothetical protein KGL63_03870 [Betaproteobacteria bacterium]|nr:hypothetical protein [Betaproteobacteria bacterium]